MYRLAGGILIVTLAAGMVSARSECNNTNYDQTSSSKIGGSVSNSGVQFDWVSDFQRKNGIVYVWNYIKNSAQSAPLNFNWKKAGLKQEFVRPLPPGDTVCSQYPVGDLTEHDIDDDAPIVYGHNNSIQRAAVYGKAVVAAADTSRVTSKIFSSYVDEAGSKRDFEVSFSYDSDGRTVSEMIIAAPDDLYVGIADAGAYWSEATVQNLAEAAKLQKSDYGYQALPTFAANGAASGAFFADWAKQNAPAAIVRGTVHVINAGETSGRTVLTELVVFDELRKPITASYVAVPVTKAERQ